MRRDGIEVDYRTWEVLLIGAVRALNMRVAEKVFREMSSFDNEVEPELKVERYNMLLCGYCYSDKIHEANRVFEDMGNNRVEPNIETYNHLITGFFVCNEYDQALGLIGLMKTTAVKPDKMTFLTELSGLSMYGEWKQVRLWFFLTLCPSYPFPSLLPYTVSRENVHLTFPQQIS